MSVVMRDVEVRPAHDIALESSESKIAWQSTSCSRSAQIHEYAVAFLCFSTHSNFFRDRLTHNLPRFAALGVLGALRPGFAHGQCVLFSASLGRYADRCLN